MVKSSPKPGTGGIPAPQQPVPPDPAPTPTERPSQCLIGTRALLIVSALVALVVTAVRMSAFWHHTVPAVLATMPVIGLLNLVPLAPLLDRLGTKLGAVHPAMVIVIDLITGVLSIWSIFPFVDVWDAAAYYEAMWPPPFANDFYAVVAFYCIIYLTLIILLLFDFALGYARLRFAIQKRVAEGEPPEKPRGLWARLCHCYVGVWVRAGGEGALDNRLQMVGHAQMYGGVGA